MKIPFPVRAVPPITFRAWLTPPPIAARIRARDEAKIAGLTPGIVGGVPTLETGAGPAVVLVHGWGGRPAQMVALAHAFATAGFRAVVPELPGHAGGEPTDIKQAAAALHDVVVEVGEPRAIVGHSFAAMVLRLAFSESAPNRVVLVAPALDVNDALEVFGDKLRLLPWARRGLRSRLEEWDPSLWPVVSGIDPGQMPGASMLLIHDPADGETSFSRSAELAALRPDTTVVAVEGAGHNRILSNPETIDLALGFVADEVGREAKAG